MMEDQKAFDVWYENEVRSGRDPSQYGGRCPLNIKPPIYPAWPYFGVCGCSIRKELEHKTDCFFYHEEHWMEGTIPTCSYHKGGLGDCPCKDCKKYIGKSEVYKLMVKKVDETDK